MGADKPKSEKPENQPQTPTPLPLIVAIALILAIALVAKASFSGEDKTPELNPKEAEKLQKRLREIDDSEQYALIAKSNGWYSCLHSGRTTFYLKAGEVWKYGVTSKGQFGRYAAKFLLRNNVLYDLQFKGTVSECLKQEQIKLFNYRYLPENLARLPTDRLSRPPYNSIMR